ncbi:MAG TPA: hypothetical protein VID03_02810 [Acidimicrobiia bacterium]|jgi:hypothetical protein
MVQSVRVAFLVVVVALLSIPLTALAQEETTTTTGGGTTTTAVTVVPAVPVTPVAEADSLADWTYRYLVPTGLVLAALVIVVTVILYFRRVVRNRYRVVN